MLGAHALGLVLAAAAGACYAGAIALYALEARRLPTGDRVRVGLLGRLVRRPLWAAAAGVDALGWPLQLAAFTLAPLTIVTPALAVGLLLLLPLGARMLGERVGAREIAATGAIVAGVATVAWGAPAHSQWAAGDPGLIAALAVLGALMFAPHLLRSRASGSVMVLAAGAAYSGAELTSKLVADQLGSGPWLGALPWGALTAVGAVVGLSSEMAALQRRAATSVAPVIFVVQIVVPVVLGVLVGGESWSKTPLGGLVIAAGLAGVGSGVLILGRTRLVGELVQTGPR